MTYANVVATLALFLSLAGSSYAVSQITTKDVKNRSLKGGDLKRETLTGKEINESKLGEVPAATVAADARGLVGLSVADIERSSRTQYATAPLTPASATDERTLFAWPEMGAEL